MGEVIMEIVSMIEDIYRLRTKQLPIGIVDYLEKEFIGLYEYLSNGETLEDFSLEIQQCMVLLQENQEVQQLLEKRLDIEFVERIELKSLNVYRIGVRRSDDIQLYYCVEGVFGKEIEETLRELEL
jgi:hypothetical protein